MQILFHYYKKHLFTRFVAIGCLNTLVGFIVFSFFIKIGLYYSAAVLIGIAICALFNFFSYSNWVFYNNNPKLLIKFIAVYAILYGANVALLHLLLIWVINIYVAQAILLFPLVLLTYVLNKNFVFRRTQLQDQLYDRYSS